MYEQACIARKKKAKTNRSEQDRERMPLSTRVKGISDAISQYQKEIRNFEKLIIQSIDLIYSTEDDSEQMRNQVFEIRNQYFTQKDLTLETGIEITKAIQSNFDLDDHLQTDCKIVFGSFNECHFKLKDIISKYEEDFLFQT